MKATMQVWKIGADEPEGEKAECIYPNELVITDEEDNELYTIYIFEYEGKEYRIEIATSLT